MAQKKEQAFNYEGASIEAIDERLAELRERKEEVVEELRAGTRIRDAKVAEESARAKAAAMTPDERRALGIPEPHVVTLEGIESDEHVGNL